MCGILFFIEGVRCKMTKKQQEADKIQDIRKLEFYRIIGEGYKAIRDGRTSTIEV